MSLALLVSSSFLPGRGGIESHLAQLCTTLSPRLAVLAPGRRDHQPLPRDLGYPTHALRGSGLIPHRGVVREIVEAAAKEKTDRVLFGTPWPLALLGPEVRAAGLRYAVVVHGAETLLPGAAPLLRRRLTRALSGADLVLPVSEFTAARVRTMLRGLPLPRLALLRAHVDLERFSPAAADPRVRGRYGLTPADRIVLYFGRLVRRKGVDRLIRAYPRITRREPKAALVVAGTGPEGARLRRLARGLEPRVIFTGPVPEEDAPALYAAADVFAFPVTDRWGGLEPEGLGVVLLEAAASGLACVTGRSGGTPEAVLHGETGYVVDARNADQLVHALAHLLSDGSTATRMGSAGRRHVARHFSRAVPGELLDWLS